jgi:integrase
MPRKARTNGSLATAKDRLTLPIAKKPVFFKLSPGLALGYRRNQSAGTWVVRKSDGEGGHWTRAIGYADDFAAADGETILTFWQAQQEAHKAAQDGKAKEVQITVADALKAYETDLHKRGGIETMKHITDHIPPSLLNKPVANLQADELRKWRDGLTGFKPATINRNMTSLKAALNYVADLNPKTISDRNPWRVGLKAIPNANDSDNVILTDGEVHQVIKAAYAHSRELGLYVETAAMTGARPSQIRKLKVRDLKDGPAPYLMMPVSAKGRGLKKISHRQNPISAELAAKLTTNRGPNEPLLLRPSGEPWQLRDHSKPFRCVAKSAGLDPEVVTFYALRHSFVVRAVLKGVPLRLIAAALDTSVPMLEMTYSKNIDQHGDAMLRGAMLVA